MPWSIVHGGGTCSDDEWAVVNDASGETEGCHETEEAAEEQRRALYANEPDAEASLMWTIREQGETWELLDAEGQVLSSGSTYSDVLAQLGQFLDLSRDLAAAAPDGGGDDGLLPESWTAPIAFLSEPTGDGRDFTDTSWTWRDPNESLLPLMLHTETDMGHFGAQLAGFVTAISHSDGVGTMAGRFYDTEEGRAARDLLLAGRRFGVSVDPGGGTEAEFRCVEEDSDGFCVAEEIAFLSYEVIGLTMTPFPGFARAHIVLDAPESVAAASASQVVPVPVRDEDAEPCHECEEQAAALRSLAAASAPVRPPSSWFTDPQLTRLTPLTVTDDGRVFGHLAPWGQCHTGYQGECVMTPRSLTNYAYFRTGAVVCDDGSEVAVGRLSVGGGHADTALSYRGATEHYDNVAAAVADIAAGEDAHGIWVAGALRPSVSDEQLRVLRASPPSGDWRPIGSGLELVAACAVNSPGFPIARVASGGRVLALVAAGHGVMASLARNPSAERIDRIEAELAELRALAAAPALARLRKAAGDRQRERLRAAARV